MSVQNAGAVAVAAIALGQGIAMFEQFLPPYHEIRNSGYDPQMYANVRAGEAVAATFVIGLGFTLTAVTEEQLPLIIAVATTGVLLLVYELALKANQEPS